MASITLLNALLQAPDQIRAELSSDWEGTDPPDFHLRPGGSVTGAGRADLESFARTSAYFLDGKSLHFFCSGRVLAQNQLDVDEPVYVAGQFNGWNKAIGNEKWRMERVEVEGGEELRLSLPLEEVDLSQGTGFKFVSWERRWFSLPTEATNTYCDPDGNQNYYIDPQRTGRHIFDLKTAEVLDLSQDYYLSLWGRGPESSTPIRPGRFFLDLEPGLKPGVFLHGDSTLFRIFAPRATRVTLVVLDHPDSWHNAGYHPLLRLSDGMWETVLEENMTGKYYWYRVDGPREGPFSHFDPNFNILDPYALATVGPGGPAIVVDRRRHAKPRAFKPPHPEDLVIGEVHLRDLLAKAPIRLSEPERLGYTGLTAWLKSPHCYLRGWGVNAVELQPIHENDALSEGDYHWGYMPVNYFSPESGYARDPLQASQVEEFRDLVEAFHEAGLAVILDVVYNHVGNPAHLAYIDQLYYFELKADGTPSNWSGCGNDLRCHAPMAKRLILDSLLHMLEFYGVDGFRFDLAELFGVEVLRAIEIRLREQFPEVILIAEPWSFRAHLRSGLKNTGYLWWNDGYREFLKSYLTGKGDAVRMQYFLTGSHSSVGAPFQSINYTGSHDDRTWLDDITENANHNAQAPTQLDRRRTHLMVSLLMMSLGTPMLAQGQDFLRTKWGHANTYLRGDINALDYQRLQDFSGTHAYFRCWIAFRQSEMASCLRLATMPGEDFFQFFSPQSGNGLACLFNAAEEHGPVQLFFVVNPEADPVRFNLAGFDFDRSWSQIADSERFDPDGLDSALAELRAELEMPAASCALWISRPG